MYRGACYWWWRGVGSGRLKIKEECGVDLIVSAKSTKVQGSNLRQIPDTERRPS